MWVRESGPQAEALEYKNYPGGAEVQPEVGPVGMRKLVDTVRLPPLPLRRCSVPLQITPDRFYEQVIAASQAKPRQEAIQIEVVEPADLLQCCLDVGRNMKEVLLSPTQKLCLLLSPMHKLTLHQLTLRDGMKVPRQACFFSFLYPCDLLSTGSTGDGHRDHVRSLPWSPISHHHRQPCTTYPTNQPRPPLTHRA